MAIRDASSARDSLVCKCRALNSVAKVRAKGSDLSAGLDEAGNLWRRVQGRSTGRLSGARPRDNGRPV